MSNKKIFFYSLLWAIAILMFMSIDSPMHESYNRVDSSWFYMAGKAWMNGLQPYVDFSDSKGPLLWLIYAVGYLLSPHSYVGIYWLTCLCYAGIFYYDFKLAHLFLNDDRRAAMATLLMTFAYFWQWFHYEIRAEDFSLFFVTLSLYESFRLLYASDRKRPDLRRPSIVLGACFMALVLIKYSIAIMQGSIILVALVYSLREQKALTQPLKWIGTGAVAVALPFVLYFLVTDTFSAFVNEYFINTFSTVKPTEGSMTKHYFEELMAAIHVPSKLSLLLIVIYGSWMLGKKLSSYRYVPAFIGIVFYLLSTMHNFLYYYCICAVFVLYIIIFTLQQLTRPLRTWAFATVLLLIAFWGIYENIHEDYPLAKVAIWADNTDKDNFDIVSGIMSSTENPRLLNLYGFEYGFGIDKKTLPAGKYWSYQNGMTPEMEQEHLELLRSRKADYVIVYDERKCKKKGITPDDITSIGYKLCHTWEHISLSNKRVKTSVYKRI